MSRPSNDPLTERAGETPRTTVLVVDDDEMTQQVLARRLDGYRRLVASDGKSALEVIFHYHVDVVLLDLQLPDTDGEELLERILAERSDIIVFVITAHTDVPRAVRCIKQGATNFLAKSYETFLSLHEHIERALEDRHRERAFESARIDDPWREVLEQLERTSSPALSAALTLLRHAAPSHLPVLIEGERGVGKELAARYLHRHSRRALRAFVPLRLASAPPEMREAILFGRKAGEARLGKLVLADGGTLFLDEIGELDDAGQQQLLRVLRRGEFARPGVVEPTPVDVRIVATTEHDLGARVAQGRFDAELLRCLNVARVRISPLRERRSDVPELCRTLAERHARRMNREVPTFTKTALRALSEHAWPGNVTELETLIMRLVAGQASRAIRLTDIPIDLCLDYLSQSAVSLAERERGKRSSLYNIACAHFERYLVRHIVERCSGNKAEAARQLGVSYATVKNKMAEPGEDGD